MPSLWILAAAWASAASYACVNFLAGACTFFELLFAKYLVIASLAALQLARSGAGLRSPVPGLQARRVLAALTAAFCFMLAAVHLPVAYTTCCEYSVSLFICAAVCFRSLRDGSGIPWKQAALVIAGFAGILLMQRPDAGLDINRGMLWVGLAGGLAATIGTLTLRRLGDAGEPASRTVFYFAATCLLASFAGVASENGLSGIRWAAVLSPALMLPGLFTLCSQFGKAIGWGKGALLPNAVLSMTGLPFAFAIDWLLFGRTFSGAAAVGMGLIAACAFLSCLQKPGLPGGTARAGSHLPASRIRQK